MPYGDRLRGTVDLSFNQNVIFEVPVQLHLFFEVQDKTFLSGSEASNKRHDANLLTGVFFGSRLRLYLHAECCRLIPLIGIPSRFSAL